MIIGIPSYKRAGLVTTIDWLARVGFPKESVIMSTQTEEDYAQYTKLYGDKATIIFRCGNSIVDNRNFLMEWMEAHGHKTMIMMDDDAKAMHILTGENKSRKIEDRELASVLKWCEATAAKMGAVIWGVYPVNNAFFQKNKITENTIVDGQIFGLPTSLRFNKNFILKSDYELCCRMISQGRKVVRFDKLAIDAKSDSAGGVKEFRSKKANIRKCAHLLTAMYPGLVALKKNGEEVRMIKQK